MTRREVLQLIAVPLLASPARGDDASPSATPGVSLGFSLYGMKDLPLAQALRVCSRIGYDGVELCLMPGWSSPASLNGEARAAVKTELADNKLRLLALMEQLSLFDREMPETVGVERLKRAAELGRAISPGRPLIETVLGGKTAEWEDSRPKLAERLTVWAEAARAEDCILCVKAHAGAAVDTPDKLLWLYRQAKIPNLKLTYDYSHFLLAGLPLESSLAAIVPEARFIHVKDAKGTAEHPQFLLCGDGGVDYERYFTLLKTARYSGPLVAEVSAQLQKAKGYDSEAAAGHAYRRLAKAISGTGLQRLRNS